MEVYKRKFKEAQKSDKEIYAIIGWIEGNNLKEDAFDAFIGDPNEAVEIYKMYKSNKVKAITKMVKEMNATLDDTIQFYKDNI